METKIKIEKGVQMTRIRRSDKGATKYPFSEMKVGDSFAVKLVGEDENKVRSMLISVSRNFRLVNNKTEWKFSTSYNKVKNEMRIWRTK